MLNIEEVVIKNSLFFLYLVKYQFLILRKLFIINEMNTSFENLNRFFESIKSIGFWKRLFGWKSIRTLSYEAYEEFKALQNELDVLNGKVTDNEHEIELLQKDTERIIQLDNEIGKLKTDIEYKAGEITKLKESLSGLDSEEKNARKQLSEKDRELQTVKINLEHLADENKSLRDENTKFRQTNETRQSDYEKSVSTLNEIKQKLLDDDKIREEQRVKEEKERWDRIRETWINHENNVESIIKNICRKYAIEYIEKENFPFKGKPDNTIKIAEEYVIFDAKSPGVDGELNNFPNYIKTQTEQLKKYAKEEGVKKDIFLVIPTTTAHKFTQFTYNIADYNVYIITADSLEPIILSLKKIEDYEFADKLNPEDRENICRVIGKLTHATKRKIQIDMFFGKNLLSVLSSAEAMIPEDFSEKIEDYERSEKINPPNERRTKLITTDELIKESDKIIKQAEAKQIEFPPLASDIKQIDSEKE